MKVAVEVWSMSSDPGYVGSDGYADVVLAPAEHVASFAGDEVALFYLKGEVIETEQIESTEPYHLHTGALNYEGIKGVLEVPDGMVAVQIIYENICTENGPRKSAYVLNPDSLKQLYQERAEHYALLAQ